MEQDEIGRGAAQAPKREWRPNEGRVRRSAAEALALIAEHNCVLPEEVVVKIVKKGWLHADVFAQYGSFASTKLYRWENLHTQADEDAEAKIVIKLREDVLESDEGIVAVLSHELFELAELEKLFETERTMTGQKLIELVGPGRPGNLHCQAWDHADAMVDAMRANAREPNDGT